MALLSNPGWHSMIVCSMQEAITGEAAPKMPRALLLILQLPVVYMCFKMRFFTK
jgi:hypothetical protein